MKNLDEVKELLGKNQDEIKLDNVRILFLDVSSTCTGYTVASVDFEKKKAHFDVAGCIWFNEKWSHQEKYQYIGSAIVNYFFIVENIDYIVLEQYSLNPKRLMGVHVVPEMTGAIKAYAWEHGLSVDSIPPQSWRSFLEIKKNSEGDYKAPTRDKINEMTTIPDEVVSNVTGNTRRTPSDLYDALGVGCGWLGKLGITKWTFNLRINSHIGALDAMV